MRPAHPPKRRSKAWLLSERVKELNCLYGISRLFERDGEDLDGTLQAVVELLPGAWLHADTAQACIELDGRYYTTDGFVDSPWQQSCPIIVLGETAGRVIVAYPTAHAEIDEGPFLAEERSLLNAVSQRLGSFIERERSRRRLLEYQDSLRSLAAELAASEQQERRHVAELLHDRVGQRLALPSINLAQARVSTGDAVLKQMLADSQALVGELIAETRSLTFELCPPILYELGLHQAVEWLGEHFATTCGLEVSVEEQDDPGVLSEPVRTVMFQAVRELLTNVAKHAGARSAKVVLRGGVGEVVVTVSDDGVGMETSRSASLVSTSHGFGLFNVRERLTYLGGSMRIESVAGRGTTVRLSVPCDA